MLHAIVEAVAAGVQTRNLTSLALAKLALVVPICRTKAGNAIRGCTYPGYERAVDCMPAKSQITHIEYLKVVRVLLRHALRYSIADECRVDCSNARRAGIAAGKSPVHPGPQYDSDARSSRTVQSLGPLLLQFPGA